MGSLPYWKSWTCNHCLSSWGLSTNKMLGVNELELLSGTSIMDGFIWLVDPALSLTIHPPILQPQHRPNLWIIILEIDTRFRCLLERRKFLIQRIEWRAQDQRRQWADPLTLLNANNNTSWFRYLLRSQHQRVRLKNPRTRSILFLLPTLISRVQWYSIRVNRWSRARCSSWSRAKKG